MKQLSIFIFFLLLLVTTSNCKHDTPSLLSYRADSLILEVVDLNNSIITANIDSIQNLFTQISEQHRILAENSGRFSELNVDIKRYYQLDSITLIVGFCLDACNDFHSEVSFIENHLQLIREEINENKSPDSTLVYKLDQESSLLNDLIFRVSLRMNLLKSHLESYDSIQPEISGYIELLGNRDPNE